MSALAEIAGALRASRGLAAKADIARVSARLGLGLDRVAAAAVGDDCAALPDGDGFLLFAIEGFMNEFVAADPWFAGWCGVMVNLSDIAAMGGRPLAVVDALWAQDDERAAPILDGMRAAAERYDVPIVGGHSNLNCDRAQLSMATLGRAKKLLTSFDAKPGDDLILAVDLRGAYRPPFNNWQAALDAPADRLRDDLALLPMIAEAGLSRAAKDVSQAGVIGTAAMLAECSGVGVTIEIGAIPKPEKIGWIQWLQSFPSFGFLIAAAREDVAEIVNLFQARAIAAAPIGRFNGSRRVTIADALAEEVIWDFARGPLLGCATREGALP